MYIASMEPPPFGDGNIKENTRSRSSSMRLQWSHRLSVMEIGSVWARCHHVVMASMEPPPFGDGNSCTTGSVCSIVSSLQWSHRLSVMEIIAATEPATFTMLLQWSHRLSVMEIGHARAGVAVGLVASMEPPPFGDGNNGRPLRRPPGPDPASMEPPPFGDGNLATGLPSSATGLGFNGATAFR